MSIGRFVGCLVVAILFGINGIYFGEGFFNLGFYTMTILSILSLFLIKEHQLVN